MKHIGIDLHTNSFTACYLEEGKSERIETFRLQGSGLQKFINTLEEEDQLALEATGNSCFFRDQVFPYVSRVVVIAPGQFDVIRRSVKKTDKHDARAIAFFLSKDMLPESRIKKTEHAQLASLIQTREQLVRLRVSLINKVHGILNRRGIKSKKETLTSQRGFEKAVKDQIWDALEQIEIDVITEQLESLRKSLKKLEKEIMSFAETLPGFKNLISIKGIGALSAAILLSTIGEISDFAKTGNLAAYLGIVPRVSQSNDQHLVGRITKRGSKIARKTLVQCTLVAKRYSPYLHSFYQHIKAKRGGGKAIIATARKFLNTIFYTLKNNWVFEDFTTFKFSAGQSS
jgi:transposase